MTRDLYTNDAYSQANPSWHEEDSPWKARQISALLAHFRIIPSTVVDVGCGAGGVLTELQKVLPSNTKLAGYDVSPAAIARCASKQNARLSFVNADYLSLETDVVDLLLAVDVVEHIEDYFGFLRSLRSRARQFVFHIPLDLHVSSVARVAPLLAARRQVGHIHYFLRETALAALTDTGYRILAERYTAGGMELASASGRAALLRWPRRILFQAVPHLAVRWLGGFSLLVLAEAK